MFRPAPQSALQLPLQLKHLYPQLESRDYSCVVAPKAGGEPLPLHFSPPLDLFTQSQLPYDIGSTEILLPPCQISSTCIIDRLAYVPGGAEVLPLKWLGQFFSPFF